MKLLVDMNLSPRWVAALESLGIPAVHWSQLGPTNAPDEALMAYAAENDWVVLTNDLDFGAILAASAGRSPSVIQPRNRSWTRPSGLPWRALARRDDDAGLPPARRSNAASVRQGGSIGCVALSLVG